MSLEYAGICCHAPGITNRPEKADPQDLHQLRQEFATMREEIEAVRPDVLIVISAEHFGNFFSNNMPTYSVGMADYYEGPIEDPDWLGIPKVQVPGDSEVARSLIENLLHETDVGFSQEWKFDHGMMVPLYHITPEFRLPVIPININCQAPPLTPLHRAYAFGKALRIAINKLPQRVALLGTGGTSHWPCTPDSGKINVDWDEEFLRRWAANDAAAMTDYKDEEILAEAGGGGLEIRTSIAVAGAAGGKGKVLFYKPIPVFACGCLIASMQLANA
jgi:aromatic ring-opening dioxygenase catalytic subunit (LigB family)